MVLVEYGINDNRFRVWERVYWLVFDSDCKHIHQRLLLGIQQVSESER